jgi:hypothetical protein
MSSLEGMNNMFFSESCTATVSSILLTLKYSHFLLQEENYEEAAAHIHRYNSSFDVEDPDPVLF